MTYAQQVAGCVLAYIDLYVALHSGHDVPASQLDQVARLARGKEVHSLVLAFERRMLALTGVRRKRSYSHHMLYSIIPIFKLCGKMWCVAMEGNESLHKKTKVFFQRLVTHNGRRGANDMAQALTQEIAGRQLAMQNAHRLPPSLYASSCVNQVIVASRPEHMEGHGAKRHVVMETVVCKGERAQKKYKPWDERMQAVQQDLAAAGRL